MIPIKHELQTELRSPSPDALSRLRIHREMAGVFMAGLHSSAARGLGAIVLGGDCGSLGIARSLGRRGIPVCFVTDNSNPLAKFSRYTSRSLSWAGSQHKDAVSDLIDLADRHGMRGWVLFPAADPEVQLIAQNHAELSKVFRLTTPPWEIAQWALDKTLTYQRAATLGIDHPKTYEPRERREVENLDCCFPLILKPAVKESRNVFTLAKAWRADDRAALLGLYDEAVVAVGQEHIVIQELIPGGGSTQFSYAAVWDRGSPIASMVARRTRQYPTDFGTGTFVETIQNKQVEESAEKFMSSLNYTGIAEIEFKYDARDGRYKILDVNARSWTWNSLGALAGVDFPHTMWRIAMGEKVDRIRVNSDARWMYLARDVLAAISEIVAGKLSLTDYLRSYRRPIAFATFDKDDLLPSLIDLPLTASRILARLLPSMPLSRRKATALWQKRNRRVNLSLPRDLHKSSTRLAGTGRIAHVHVFKDFAAAEFYWRWLEREHAVATPYQQYDLLELWQRNVGQHTGYTPFIVVGCDADGQPLFLWPLTLVKNGPVRTLQFLGAKHVNFNFGLWRRDAAATITAANLRKIFHQVTDGGREIDLILFRSQPRIWRDVANPFAMLPHSQSPNNGRRMDLSASGNKLIYQHLSGSMRRKLRGKQRRLMELPDYRYFRASAPGEVDGFLNEFFKLKSMHFSALGLKNVFEQPGVEPFVREACHRDLANGRPLIEVHVLEADRQMLAMFAGTSGDGRFTTMFNTYTLSQHARHSPGVILLQHMISDLADRGFKSFDLGIGEAEYKAIFCKQSEQLFDTFLPLTTRGWLAASVLSMASSLKRMVKQNATFWAGVQAFRRQVFGKKVSASW
jgi:D-aspartate ligase